MEKRDKVELCSFSWDTVDYVIEILQREKALIEQRGGTDILFNMEVDHDDGA